MIRYNRRETRELARLIARAAVDVPELREVTWSRGIATLAGRKVRVVVPREIDGDGWRLLLEGGYTAHAAHDAGGALNFLTWSLTGAPRRD